MSGTTQKGKLLKGFLIYLLIHLCCNSVFAQKNEKDSDQPRSKANTIVQGSRQQPENDTLYTQNISLAINNSGGMGLGGSEGGGQMNFYPWIECDDCPVGPNNRAERYLFDASPFVMRIDGDDTLFFADIAYHDWLSQYPGTGRPNGMIQQTSIEEYGGNGIFNMVRNSGVFYTADSTIALEKFYYAPQGAASKSIGIGMKVYNISDQILNDVWIGDIDDWDIPSDSLYNNGGSFNESRQLIYQYGWETAEPDTFCGGQNDCAEADRRYGGSTFMGRFKYDGSTGNMEFEGYPHLAFTWKLSSLLNEGYVVYDSLFNPWITDELMGYVSYTAFAPPDSHFVDLVTVTLYGNYNLDTEDTLYILRAITSEYQDSGSETDPSDFLNSSDYIRSIMQEQAGYCCRIWGHPGDCNTDGTIDLLDILCMIDYKFKNGEGVIWPGPSNPHIGPFQCRSIIDCNGDGTINLLDVLVLINYKFKHGPAPVCPL